MFSFIQYNCMWVLVKFCTHRKFLNNQASSHLKDLADRSQTAGLIVAEPSALRSFFCEISSQLGFGRQNPSKFLGFKLFGKAYSQGSIRGPCCCDRLRLLADFPWYTLLHFFSSSLSHSLYLLCPIIPQLVSYRWLPEACWGFTPISHCMNLHFIKLLSCVNKLQFMPKLILKWGLWAAIAFSVSVHTHSTESKALHWVLQRLVCCTDDKLHFTT